MGNKITSYIFEKRDRFTLFLFLVGEDGGQEWIWFVSFQDTKELWRLAFFFLFAIFTFAMFTIQIHIVWIHHHHSPSTIFTVTATFVPIQNRWTQSLAHNMALCACGIVNNMRRWCTSTSIYHNHLSHK